MEVIATHEERSSAEWPQDLLDVDALLSSGWTPRPFRQFILKIHSRCNLACDYCYVYRSADQSWKDQPVRMSESTVVQAAARIAEHAVRHGMPRVEVVLHGGEPLLAGPRFLGFVAETFRSAAPPGVEIDLNVHTNATLIAPPVLDVLSEHGVRVGISYDGDPEIHDVHRTYPSGRGSYDELVKGIDLLRSSRYRHLFAGLLCVIDPDSDPIATYESLIAFEPPAVDLLLPHANWSNPPDRDGGSSGRYGDWLAAAFDRWFDAPKRETSIRFFDEIIRGVLGRPSRVETIGLSPVRLIVVETDGRIEQSDSLKSAYEGAARTALHVARDEFDAALLIPQIVARQIGVAALSETCRRCELRGVCGGGFYSHRYQSGSGFRHPSVYCDDLVRLIRHVEGRVRSDLGMFKTEPSR